MQTPFEHFIMNRSPLGQASLSMYNGANIKLVKLAPLGILNHKELPIYTLTYIKRKEKRFGSVNLTLTGFTTGHSKFPGHGTLGNRNKTTSWQMGGGGTVWKIMGQNAQFRRGTCTSTLS